MRSESRIPFSGYLILSFLLHIGLWIFPSILPKVEPKPIIERVEMSVVETPPEEVVKAKLPTVDEKKKIVDQDKLNDELDDKAKLLSAHNQKVIKETIAQQRGDFKNQAAKPALPGEGSPQPPEKKPFEDFVPKLDVAKVMKERQEMEEKFDQDADFRMEEVKKKESKPPKVAPQQKQAALPGGDASQTLDYIKELDPGLETMLSTKEFKFYTYFSRIRQQLNQHWTPLVRRKVQQIYKSGRSIASSDDMVTRCLVTLDKGGKLVRIQIIGDSGIRELDEAAVEAFRAAAPFPNPPKGMVDDDGTIKIRWDFILEA